MVTTLASKTDVRAEKRYAARHTLWSESTLSRVRSCGRAVQGGGAGVTVKVSTSEGRRSAGFGGLQHCGSVWSCPVCSAKVAATRQKDIEAALSAWVGGVAPRGSFGGSGVVPVFGRVALVTLTMRHHRGQSLASLWGALAESWNLAASGAGWAADQLAHGETGEWVRKVGKTWEIVLLGSIPIIRVVEVTYGGFGWHVHIHALLLLPLSASDESVRRLGGSMFGRWSAALKDRGLSAVRAVRQADGSFRDVGVDARLLKGDPAAALGEYFVKATYSGSMEVARADLKSASMGNRTPFAVLADVVATGDADDLDTWHEYERASKGKRQITWSHGLRARLLPDLPVEASDQDLADEAPGGDVVVEVNGDVWRAVVAARADYRLKAAFERSDRDGFALLFAFGHVAGEGGAAEWARLKAEPDPLRRRWQTREPR